MKRVAIVQEFVPGYRVPFFKLLRDRAWMEDIDVTVYAGRPSHRFRTRQDHQGDEAHIQTVRQLQGTLLKRRVTLRALPPAVWASDLIVVEHARRNFDTYLLLLVRSSHTALWGHGRDFVQEVGTIARRLMTWQARRARHYFAYTQAGASALTSDGLSPQHITIVQNSKAPVPVCVQTERSNISELDPEWRLTYLGALDVGKSLDFLMDAAYRIVEGNPRARLTIIGSGPLEQQLRSQHGRVPWLTFKGHLAGDSLARELERTDLLLNPGRVGLVAIDSFTSECPIVTTAEAPHAPEFEYLADGVNASIVSGDAHAFAERVTWLMQTPTLRGQLEEGCRRSAGAYSLEHMVEQFMVGMREALA